MQPTTKGTLWIFNQLCWTALFTFCISVVFVQAQSSRRRAKLNLPPIADFVAKPFSWYSVEVSWLDPDVSNNIYKKLQHDIVVKTSDDITVQKTSFRPLYERVAGVGRNFYLVPGLLPSTEYKFQITVNHPRAIAKVKSPVISAKTRIYPGPLELVSATNTTITVQWITSNESLFSRHVFEWRKANDKPNPSGDYLWQRTSLRVSRPLRTYVHTMGNLKPDTLYLFRVKVLYRDSYTGILPAYLTSNKRFEPFLFRTGVSAPDQISPVHMTNPDQLKPYHFVASWTAPTNNGAKILQYKLQMKEIKPERSNTSGPTSNWVTIYSGTNLTFPLPKSLPRGRQYALVVSAKNRVGWSSPSREVLITIPLPPTTTISPEMRLLNLLPHIEHSASTGDVVVSWLGNQDSKKSPQIYRLLLSSITPNESSNWTVVYQGVNNSYTLTSHLEAGNKYAVRVQTALSADKWDQPGPTTLFNFPFLYSAGGVMPVVETEIQVATPDSRMNPDSPDFTEGDSQSTLFLILVASLLFAGLAIMVLVFIYMYARKRKWIKPKNAKYSNGNVTLHGAELNDPMTASLYDRRPYPPLGAVEKNNELYLLNYIDDKELNSLPRISRDTIRLTCFLGSGAFAEVYEGVAVDLQSGEPETRVAVKILKKSSSLQEIEEFLSEARLVNTFRHEHIVRFLGVSLDSEPFQMVFELLEGGDLLSFLRRARSMKHHGDLCMSDLLGVCRQIACGCRYLEEMHFVHRDIAARNCLISTKDPAESPRIVKLGDFGLARDIYRNDYYRKEGEGLLPVRWMPPEALVDGIFSMHSDVWAYGVVIWEVLTLGQQPYPARSNMEVFAYVREGGRLEQPPSCSDQMYDLMQRCWSGQAADRPSFKHVVEELETLEGIAQLHEFIASCYSNNSLNGNDESVEGEVCCDDSLTTFSNAGTCCIQTPAASSEGSKCSSNAYMKPNRTLNEVQFDANTDSPNGVFPYLHVTSSSTCSSAESRYHTGTTGATSSRHSACIHDEAFTDNCTSVVPTRCHKTTAAV